MRTSFSFPPSHVVVAKMLSHIVSVRHAAAQRADRLIARRAGRATALEKPRLAARRDSGGATGENEARETVENRLALVDLDAADQVVSMAGDDVGPRVDDAVKELHEVIAGNRIVSSSPVAD